MKNNNFIFSFLLVISANTCLGMCQPKRPPKNIIEAIDRNDKDSIQYFIAANATEETHVVYDWGCCCLLIPTPCPMVTSPLAYAIKQKKLYLALEIVHLMRAQNLKVALRVNTPAFCSPCDPKRDSLINYILDKHSKTAGADELLECLFKQPDNPENINYKTFTLLAKKMPTKIDKYIQSCDLATRQSNIKAITTYCSTETLITTLEESKNNKNYINFLNKSMKVALTTEKRNALLELKGIADLHLTDNPPATNRCYQPVPTDEWGSLLCLDVAAPKND
jgi:hypothetical protein